MDCNYADFYNHLLTQTCSCSGEAEMLVDFVGDFIVRCTKCRLSTHAYIRPENAAKHWNAGDDIMSTPLNIFWDDPTGYLQGEVTAIHIADDEFDPVTHDHINFLYAIIVYTDKKLRISHDSYDGKDTIDIERISAFNHDRYCHTICPERGEKIKFESIVISKDRSILQLRFSQNKSRLLIKASSCNLTLRNIHI